MFDDLTKAFKRTDPSTAAQAGTRPMAQGAASPRLAREDIKPIDLAAMEESIRAVQRDALERRRSDQISSELLSMPVNA